MKKYIYEIVSIVCWLAAGVSTVIDGHFTQTTAWLAYLYALLILIINLIKKCVEEKYKN